MIIALAGRRIDAPDAKASRFPLSKVDEVKEKLRALFISLKPKTLVCSAACGADLLALQVAGELGIQRSILIPFDEQLFKSTSVMDRPGDWDLLYDKICDAVANEEGIDLPSQTMTEIKSSDPRLFANAFAFSRMSILVLRYVSSSFCG